MSVKKVLRVALRSAARQGKCSSNQRGKRLRLGNTTRTRFASPGYVYRKVKMLRVSGARYRTPVLRE